MRIASVRHKGLRRLLEHDDPKGLHAEQLKRIRRVLTVLYSAENMDGVKGPPGWRIHLLHGDRAGTWSISVSGNWRITFRIEEGAIHELNLEDYH